MVCSEFDTVKCRFEGRCKLVCHAPHMHKTVHGLFPMEFDRIKRPTSEIGDWLLWTKLRNPYLLRAEAP